MCRNRVLNKSTKRSWAICRHGYVQVWAQAFIFFIFSFWLARRTNYMLHKDVRHWVCKLDATGLMKGTFKCNIWNVSCLGAKEQCWIWNVASWYPDKANNLKLVHKHYCKALWDLHPEMPYGGGFHCVYQTEQESHYGFRQSKSQQLLN
jgi:hypothetical protein